MSMAKRKHLEHFESSDDEAPEAFSFGSSRKAAKGEEEAVRQYHAAQKLKQKEKNRAVDRTLKERAAAAKGKRKPQAVGVSHWEKATKGKGIAQGGAEDDRGSDGSGEDPSRNALEERMARAMREAEEEDSELDEEGSAFGGFSGANAEIEEAEDSENDEEEDEELEEGDGSAADEDQDETDEKVDSEDADEEMASTSGEDSEDSEPSPPKPSKPKHNYLPDHLFKSALSHTASRNTKITFEDEDTAPSRPSASPPQKRRRAKSPAKDIVLGSRTIRTLSKNTEAITPAAAKGLPPPRRVEKFVKHSLNLKGDPQKSRMKGWTRRAANLGVMKRNGPAANFVRSS
ncbi:hypothetical protein BD414DRAFT_468722 [Trametes punicea]|nr:hypothetical protein BD414DRAFT_468722 [Trametes punicea]